MYSVEYAKSNVRSSQAPRARTELARLTSAQFPPLLTHPNLSPVCAQRSTCKGCKIKIDKGVVRVGTTVPGPGDYDITSWRHLACQKKKPATVDGLSGLGALAPADVDLVRAWFAGDVAAVAADKRKSDAASAAAAASTSTPKKAKPSSTAHAATPPTKGPLFTSASASASASSSMPLAEEMASRDAAAQVFNLLTIPSLKSCLRANEQLLGGTKPELVERCVDRKLYGNLPRCPECNIGRLKVSYARAFGHAGQGQFTCPGGYDDDEYKRCGFRASQAERPAWTVTEWERDAPAASPKKSTGAGKQKAHKSDAPAAASAASPAYMPVPRVAMPGDDD